MFRPNGSRRGITLPPGWAFNNISLHFEGEDLTQEKNPFAASILVRLRVDVDPSKSMVDVARADLAILQTAHPDVTVLATGEINVGGERFSQLEVTFDDPRIGLLQQLILYVGGPDRVYSVVGTHRAGAPFEKRRPDIHATAKALQMSGL